MISDSKTNNTVNTALTMETVLLVSSLVLQGRLDLENYPGYEQIIVQCSVSLLQQLDNKYVELLQLKTILCLHLQFTEK